MTDQPTALADALVQLQAALPRITKTDRGQAGNRETRYANLNTITDAVFPVLHEHKFAWICQPGMTGDRFVLHYRLIYAPTGEEIAGDYPLPSSNPQTILGAMTYGRRGALCAVLGIAPAEDDDDAEYDARERAERQNSRTRHIAEESAMAPLAGRPADRIRGRLPDDQWTREPAQEAP